MTCTSTSDPAATVVAFNIDSEGKINVRSKGDDSADFVAGLQEELGAQHTFALPLYFKRN